MNIIKLGTMKVTKNNYRKNLNTEPFRNKTNYVTPGDHIKIVHINISERQKEISKVHISTSIQQSLV